MAPIPPAQAQFNPSGRTRSKPKVTGGAGRGGRPAAAPSGAALIARYTGIVLSQPSAPFPLQRLCDLYRERDGNLDRLIQDFEARAKGGEHAARVALGGIYRQAGQTEQAITAYENALAARPDDAGALLGLARLREDHGDKAAALERYASALDHLGSSAESEQVLRTVLGLCLDLGRWDEAKTYHQKLVQRANGSFFVRSELARELMARNEYERAVAEYAHLLSTVTGDARVQPPLLRDYGRALARTGKLEEASKQLGLALKSARNAPGLRREIYEILAEVYRSSHRLPELIAELEADTTPDPSRLVLLGSLYEETGQLDKALRTYQLALARNRQDLDTRLKVVRLLQIAGKLDQAIAEQEALVRAAPHNPEYAFRLAESLLQRGDRRQALAHLRTLEARNLKDEDVLAALVDFYERAGEKEKARELLERLTARGSRDPRNLVELGSRFWRDGDKDRALATWKRIEIVVPNRAQALHALGEVYLEHDLSAEALAALQKAADLDPKNQGCQRSLALAHERMTSTASDQQTRSTQQKRALELWESLLHDERSSPQLKREARQRIVTVWRQEGGVERRLRSLSRRFQKSPPDLEAGRLLGEAQLKLRQYPAAERTFAEVVRRAPGDVESLVRLERALTLQQKRRRALEVLQKLVRADPKRAREYYQRMVRLAAELYEDGLAIQYALQAVALSPDDAEGYRKLGELYLRRQQTADAAAAFRNAIRKNDRLFSVHFELAQVLIDEGQVEEADQLLRHVVRSSPDDALVTQAARLSMQVNVTRGRLETLEQELLPLALANPAKPVYRRLLIDVYSALAFPLIHAESGTDLERAQAARKQLSEIGERAVKPLLDALGDAGDTQQAIAVELLGHIRNRSGGPALFAYATGTADAALRTRAMVAVGSLEDPSLLPLLRGLVLPGGEPRSDESDPVIIAAVWSLARLDSPKTLTSLLALLDSNAPSIRALGVLGLARHRGPHVVRRLLQIAEDPAEGPVPRAASAFALGQLRAAPSAEILARLASARDELLASHALLALSRARSELAPQALAEALFSTSNMVREAAVEAAVVWATDEYAGKDPLRIPQGRVDVRSLLAVFEPTRSRVADRTRALVELLAPIQEASIAAVQSSPERAQVIADMLLSRGGEPAFGLFTHDLDRAEGDLRAQAERAALAVAASVTEPFVALCRHPSAEVRARAVRFLASVDDEAVWPAVAEALADRDPAVVESALAALRPVHVAGARSRVADLLAHASDWSLRVRAAEALGRLAHGTADVEVVGALAGAAEADRFALVREAAVRALVRVDARAAAAVLRRVANRDHEPRVRQTARALLR